MKNNIYIDTKKFSFYNNEIIYIIIMTFKLCFKFISSKLEKSNFDYKEKYDKLIEQEDYIMEKIDRYIKNNKLK